MDLLAGADSAQHLVQRSAAQVSRARDSGRNDRLRNAEHRWGTFERRGVAQVAVMSRISVCFAFCATMLPSLGLACEGGWLKCQEAFSELVTYRAQAIEQAFGDFRAVMPERIVIKFVGPRDEEYKRYARRIAYDIEQEVLVVPKFLTGARFPSPMHATANYWPFYENELYREMFPIVLAVDNALWGAYLQEAAQVKGLTWPHANCGSLDIGRRLPCEMLVHGVAAHLTSIRDPLFNTNRLDRIWPSDFRAFRARVWRRDDNRYLEVQHYGGMMLVKPLIDEFGAPAALVYFAQTPFEMQQDDLHDSAVRYQERARAWLEANRDTKLKRVTVVSTLE